MVKTSLFADQEREAKLNKPGDALKAQLECRCIQFAAPGLLEGGSGRGVLTPAVYSDCSAPFKRGGKQPGLTSKNASAGIATGDYVEITGNSTCPTVTMGTVGFSSTRELEIYRLSENMRSNAAHLLSL